MIWSWFVKTWNSITRFLEEKPAFNLDNFCEITFIEKFRFSKKGVKWLFRALDIPEMINIRQSTVRLDVSGLEALCILLRRLAFPLRLTVDFKDFNWSKTSLSYIVNYLVDWIFLASPVQQHHLGTIQASASQTRLY